VQFILTEAAAFWRFKHPTIGDAFAALLLENPELLGIYVQGSPIDKLVGQITCGNVGLENAVALPATFSPLVLKRLNDFSSSQQFKSRLLSRWSARTEVNRFLAFRCSKEFLTRYIQEHPEVIDEVSRPGLYLSAVSEVDLAVRLHEFGLLPEHCRKRFVATVTSYAIEGEDLHALGSLGIQTVFTEAEIDELRARVRTELLPKLAEVRRTWQYNRASDLDPDEHMQPFLDSLSTLKEEFADEAKMIRIIDREAELAREWISEQLADDSEEQETNGRSFGDVDASDHPPAQDRGIFDDVDE
jgi:hypothetical protein